MWWIVILLFELAALLAVAAVAGTALTLHSALKQHRAHDSESYARGLKGSFAPYKKPILDAIARARLLDTCSVVTMARDGERLYGEWFPADGEARGTILLFHGYRSNARGDFACVMPLFHKLGWNELLVDERAQGRSGGKRMGLGVLERFDVADWAAWCAARYPGKPIVLDGISMGASAVMMAAELELPEEVCGLIADSGFTSPEDIVRYLLSRYGVLGRPLLPLCGVLAKPILGYGLRDADTVRSLARSSLPLLLVHGKGDTMVPCEMSQRNYDAAAAEDKTLVLVPEAEHGLGFLVDRESCTRELRSFLNRAAPVNTGAVR